MNLMFSEEPQHPLFDKHLQNLSEAEISNPLIVLKAVFKNYDFEYYKAALRDWLEGALNSGFSDSMGQNIFPLYPSAKKLIEACWLLHYYAKGQKKDQGINLLTAFEQTCPMLLQEPNLSNPYKEVESFFSGASLGEYRKDLKDWFRAALIEHISARHRSSLFHFHSQLIRLIHAGYLIVQHDLIYQRTEPYCSNALTFKDWIIGVRERTESETGLLTSDYDLFVLSDEEKLNPLESIR